MSDTLIIFLAAIILTAGYTLANILIMRDAARQIRDAHEKGYMRGYIDKALGRSRHYFRRSPSGASDENQNNTPERHDSAQGQ